MDMPHDSVFQSLHYKWIVSMFYFTLSSCHPELPIEETLRHTLVTAGLSVAQLDVCLTGDQEVVGSLLWSGTILSLRLNMKSFLWSFSPFH